MAIRNIRKKNEDVLRKKSKVVEKIDNRTLTLIEDMIDTMYEADGVGLAAPQVGILKRIFVVDVYDGEGPRVFINPEILSSKGSQVGEEGCLSAPGEFGDVDRPNYVKVTALNEKGEKFTLEAEEFLARAICHEYDHLEGVIFLDKVQK